GRTRRVEQLVRVVGGEPVLQQGQVGRVLPHVGQRDLVGAPGALHLESVHHVGTGPALGGAEHDHRPHGVHDTVGVGCVGVAVAGPPLDVPDVGQAVVEGPGEVAVGGGVVGRVSHGDQARCIAEPLEVAAQPVLGHAGQHGRVGDLVAV